MKLATWPIRKCAVNGMMSTRVVVRPSPPSASRPFSSSQRGRGPMSPQCPVLLPQPLAASILLLVSTNVHLSGVIQCWFFASLGLCHSAYCLQGLSVLQPVLELPPVLRLSDIPCVDGHAWLSVCPPRATRAASPFCPP